jgi:hypothetical protein
VIFIQFLSYLDNSMFSSCGLDHFVSEPFKFNLLLMIMLCCGLYRYIQRRSMHGTEYWNWNITSNTSYIDVL